MRGFIKKGIGRIMAWEGITGCKKKRRDQYVFVERTKVPTGGQGEETKRGQTLGL